MRLTSKQLCSDFALKDRASNVLIVGAERSDEFANATRLEERFHSVIVVNPRESAAARRFVSEGGTFLRSAIERLPSALGPFNLICENYPYTVARVEGVCHDKPCPIWLSESEVRAYAMARLNRLAPRGRWIVFTESPGFARALHSIGHSDRTIRPSFSVHVVRLVNDEAPQSSYPRLATRFKVIFRRRPPNPQRTRSVYARIVYL
jgi:hypothetical protein